RHSLEPEGIELPPDVLPAEPDRGRVRVDAHVAAALVEIPGERYREPPHAAADVQHPMMGLEASQNRRLEEAVAGFHETPALGVVRQEVLRRGGVPQRRAPLSAGTLRKGGPQTRARAPPPPPHARARTR